MQCGENKPLVVLAPMHGLADVVMRDMLTQIGGIDRCVSEFVRVTHTVHSRAVWYRHIPELNNSGCTPAGVPVAVQLLGSDPVMMAENARVAVECGARHIDLNFGCPAPTVNRHSGGAALLKEPRQIEKIVHTVRSALPYEVLLSAKIRLGYDDTSLAEECALAVVQGGATEMTVHARTKKEGYRPPAHWDWIARLRQIAEIPVIANGDVFTVENYREIRGVSGCRDVMVGRGAVRNPFLAGQIAAGNKKETFKGGGAAVLVGWLRQFSDLCHRHADESGSRYPEARLKQWLGMLKTVFPVAGDIFADVRTLTDPIAIAAVLDRYGSRFPGKEYAL